MIKVTQTWLGGKDAPIDGNGNCFQACVASVLEIPLEGSFNHGGFSDKDWFEQFNMWLRQYGLGCIFVECSEEKPLTSSPLCGIHIAEMQPENGGVLHAVVIDGDKIIHDPMPYERNGYNCCGIYIFVPLDPKSCRRRRESKSKIG